MSEQTLRRNSWSQGLTARRQEPVEPHADRPNDDPLAELERIVRRGDPFADRAQRPATNVEPFPARRDPPSLFQAPAKPAEPADPFGGIDEREFEAALRGTIPPEPRLPRISPEDLAGFSEAELAAFEAELIRQEQAEAAAKAVSAPKAAVAHVIARSPGRPPTALDAEFLARLDAELSKPDQAPAVIDEPSAAPVAPVVHGFQTAPQPPVSDHAHQAYEPRAVEPEPMAEPEPVAERPRRFAGSGMMTVAAVLGLVVIGAGGAVGYTMLTGGARSTGEPVVVRADSRPTRVAAEPAPATDQQNKIIYDRLGQQQNPTAERVVPRQEEPIEQRRDVRVVLPGAPAAPAATPPITEPRRVQTTTIRVRPDGTLESEPTGRAPTAAAPTPAPRPQAAAPTPATTPAPVTTTASAPPRAAEPATPRAQAQRPPAEPAPRVAAAEPTQRAPQPRPAATTQAPATGGALVQVTSQRTESAARQAYTDLQRRFPALLSSRQPNIRAVDLGERGTFHRVRVGGFASRDEAAQFCQRLRTAGGDCVIATN